MKNIQNILLYLLFFSINFEVWDPLQTGGSFSVVKLVGLLYVVVMLPSLRDVFAQFDRRVFRLVWPLLLFYALLCVMNVLHVNEVSDVIFNSTIIQWMAFMLLIIAHVRLRPHVQERMMLAFAFGSMVVGGCFLAGVGITGWEGRLSVFGDNQNSVGLRMAVSTAFVIYLTMNNVIHWPFLLRLVLAIGGCVLMVPLLLATGSRVAFFSLVGMLLALAVLLKTENKYVRPLLFLSVVAVLATFLYVASQDELLVGRLLKSAQDGDLSKRDDIWRTLMPLVEEHPLFGVGETGYLKYVLPLYGEPKSPHNVVFELICYTGVVGMLIYMLFLFKLLCLAWHLYRSQGVLYPLLLFVPFLGIILSSQMLGFKTCWCLFAYIAAHYCVQQDAEDAWQDAEDTPQDVENNQ